MNTQRVTVVEKILSANDQIASMNRKLIDEFRSILIKSDGFARFWKNKLYSTDH